MTNKEYIQAWQTLPSDKLRKMYWALYCLSNKKLNDLNEFNTFKIQSIKEILIDRLEW